jgi:hypothetical protein
MRSSRRIVLRKSTYAFGLESPVKFEISDRLASDYNAATEKFLKAQSRLTQQWGKRWDPTKKPISVEWTRRQQRAWNQLADIFVAVTREAAKQGFTFRDSDFMDDYLVKDVALQTAQMIMGKGSRAITLALWSGALYGYLRGL